jgi:hypothetical protein
MTVCAGFLCSDGLIIGADTEMSGGIKYHAAKLRRDSFAAGEYVLTGTGNTSYLGMAADMIHYALYDKREKFEKANSIEEKARVFSGAIRGIIRKIHKDYINALAYGIQLELIIGAHFTGEDEQLRLMHCALDGGVGWIDHHITAGSGSDIAMRFLTILSPGPCPMKLMTPIAFFCLAQGKLGAEGAGGVSHLMKLPPPSSTLQTVWSDAQMVELAEEALRLAIRYPREAMELERFNAILTKFSDDVRSLKEALEQSIASETIALELIQKAKNTESLQTP